MAGTGPSSKNLVDGPVPSSKNLVDGPVPSSKNLVDGTVPATNSDLVFNEYENNDIIKQH